MPEKWNQADVWDLKITNLKASDKLPHKALMVEANTHGW